MHILKQTKLEMLVSKLVVTGKTIQRVLFTVLSAYI